MLFGVTVLATAILVSAVIAVLVDLAYQAISRTRLAAVPIFLLVTVFLAVVLGSLRTPALGVYL